MAANIDLVALSLAFSVEYIPETLATFLRALTAAFQYPGALNLAAIFFQVIIKILITSHLLNVTAWQLFFNNLTTSLRFSIAPDHFEVATFQLLL